MITIGSYLHREELRDLISRAMHGTPAPDDGEALTRLVHFNQLFVYRYLRIFCRRLFGALHGPDLREEEIDNKGRLKAAIVRRPPYRNERIDALISAFEEQPGRYYLETPCRAVLVFGKGDSKERFVGSWRIKRVRRLAEKVARRISDWIYDAIKKRAMDLAAERAARLHVPRESLLSTPEEMLAEFIAAEERFTQDMKNLRIANDPDLLVINDVAGVKVVLEDGERAALRRALETFENCRVIEEERHQGLYNADNLVVRIEPPKEEIVSRPIPPVVREALVRRGMGVDRQADEFAAFVRSGEREVDLEIICSNYQELLESEIGRCMHEDRIISQRLHQQYRGHLAKNVEYLVRYLFLFPFSDRPDLEELPVRIWDRYLPDYFDSVIARLFHIPPGDY